MKLLAMLIVTITVGASTTTVINIPDGSWMAIVPKETLCQDFQQPSAVAVSTGPFKMRVSTDPLSDCYQADGIYPNGQMVNERWIPCQ